MSVFSKMKQEREKLRSDSGFGKSSGSKDRAEWFNLKRPGVYGVFICPMARTRTDGELPYVPLQVHYRVGPDNKMHTCLSKTNVGVWNKSTLGAIKSRNDKNRAEHPDWVVRLDPKDGCPTCDLLADPASHLSASEIKDMRKQDKCLFFVVPVWFDPQSGGSRETFPGREVQPFFSSTKLADDIIDAVSSSEIDIFDPERAVLVQLKRTGTTFRDTRYSAALDVKTATKPIRLHKAIAARIATMVPGGEHDVYGLVSGLTRDADGVRDLLGVGGGDDVEVEGRQPDCFGDETQLDPNDSMCKACAFRDDCAKEALGAGSFDEIVSDDDSDDSPDDSDDSPDDSDDSPDDSPDDSDDPPDDEIADEFEALLAEMED